MNNSTTEPLNEPGLAHAEAGVVILEGPDGIAATMTAEAAAQTGHNLIEAARRALEQRSHQEESLHE